MNQQLTIALEQANKIIATQLRLEQCPCEGLPNLQNEQCIQCDQISPCIWRFHASNDIPKSLNTQEQYQDFIFAYRLIHQAVANLTLSPHYHQQAQMWLQNTAALLPIPKEP